MISWAEVCESPHLKDLPYKIETNRHGKILMSPTYLWHGNYQFEIGSLLKRLMPSGRVITECAVDTTDGTRVADVAWVSKERFAPYKKAYSLPIAPEICVEILSNSNTKEEMQGKMQLYFAAGAQEVWLCDESGTMEFYGFDQVEAIPQSRLCATFPLKLELD
jgi:Uma2 family endonuclease